MKKFDFWLSVTIITLSIAVMFYSNRLFAYETQYDAVQYYPARVLSISDTEKQTTPDYYGEGSSVSMQTAFVAEITGGDQKGEKIGAVQYFDELLNSTPRIVRAGDRIILTKAAENDVIAGTWIMANFDRTVPLIILVLVFLGVVILVGQKKGIMAIISLTLTVGAIFFIYIPAILSGFNVYLITVIIAMYIIIMSLLLLNGTSPKTLCAITGNIAGVLVAGLLCLAVNRLFLITGIINQEYIYLSYLGGTGKFNLPAIVWSGVVIGALGAVMDVAMSIASSMNELSIAMENKTRRHLIRSGLNIGHDVIGTMMNTLVLAYIGSSLVSVLLIMVYNNNPLTIFNAELVLVDIIQAVIGSMGILLTVPCTVLFSAYIFFDERKKSEKQIGFNNS